MPRKPNNDEVPERIARPGLGGGQRRDRFHGPHGKGAGSAAGGRSSASRGSTSFEHYARPQRVVVKTHIVRHQSAQKGRASITRHVRYLSREAVTRDVGSGRFYDAKRDELDAKTETKSWSPDRHHFRVILSPENARSLADLKAYAREVMVRVEGDLGPLQWLAVNHTNTDNPHTHLLIRGKAQDGADLVISRQYISHGIRQRAAEVATEWLGERTREEAQIAVANEVRAERWTSIDGALARVAQPVADGLKIDMKEVKLSRYALITRELLAERLKFLGQAGLAQELPPEKRTFLGRPPVWRLVPDFQKQLNELGARQDIIKNLYAAMGQAAAPIAPQVRRAVSDQQLSDEAQPAIRGVVIAKGPTNELNDERFVVLEDRAGTPHYVRLWASDALEAARVGGVLEVGRSAHRRWRIAREVVRVAEFSGDGHYSTGRHRKWLQAKHPQAGEQQVDRHLRAFSFNVTNLSKRADSGVVRASENAFAVDRHKLEKFTARRNRWPDVRLVAAHALNEQVEAHAWTWLDRQIFRIQSSKAVPTNDIVHNAQVQNAVARRSDWLVEHGYAKRGGGREAKAIAYLQAAVSRLVAFEHKEFAQNCNQKLGKGVEYVRDGQAVTGVYRGMMYQHRGSFALIETEGSVFAAPVSRAPWAEKGQRVIARSVAPKFTRIELDRGGRSTKPFGMER
ncbi:MAG: DUF3363 domain-containing protein [Phycisphaerae bacterium]|nr:DUF3363 domain-containing protein [Phycisphaerae bacterium]